MRKKLDVMLDKGNGSVKIGTFYPKNPSFLDLSLKSIPPKDQRVVERLAILLQDMKWRDIYVMWMDGSGKERGQVSLYLK